MLEKASSPNKKQRHIGSVRISSNELPEIKDWAISGEYEITLKVKMTSIEEVDKYDQDQYSNLSKNDVMSRFDIKSVVSPSKEAKKKVNQDLSRGALNNPVKYK